MGARELTYLSFKERLIIQEAPVQTRKHDTERPLQTLLLRRSQTFRGNTARKLNKLLSSHSTQVLESSLGLMFQASTLEKELPTKKSLS